MGKAKVFMGSTEIATEKTIAEISGLVRQMGATNVSIDYGPKGAVRAVRFTLPIAGLPTPIAFLLPCRTDKLLKLFRGNVAQAERTAWRQILRWVEAQFALIDAGMVQAPEVFMPYALSPGENATMFQLWEESQMKLLPAPAKAGDL